MSRAETPILDVDLLLGRDPMTGARTTEQDLAAWVGPVVRGGLLGSQRALAFDARSGNAEVMDAAARLGLTPTLALETRDWIGSRDAVEAAPEGTIVRLAPQRQDCAPGHPGFRAIVRACAARGLVVLTEGDLRVWGPAYADHGLTVVFLDAHFYHLGDFVALVADEPGFHASTRLLNGPDSFTIARDEVGVGRLVFGSRQGFHEGRSALQRLLTCDLDAADRAAVAHHNLRRLMTERP